MTRLHSAPLQMAVMVLVAIFAFGVAALSVVDMYLPRPYDGVYLNADAPSSLIVREVMPGSGAEAAGIRPGDEIVGIARSAVRSAGHAAALLNNHTIGEVVAYLVRSGDTLREVQVKLGPHRIGDSTFLYACFLAFSFFFVGLFVLAQQPRLQASQVFFILCCLFMLFLACRLRPASYSWVDTFVLTAGTAALVFLPASFLHFFVIFPHPLWDVTGSRFAAWGPVAWRRLIAGIYALPPLVLVTTLALTLWRHRPYLLISGAPAANWWVLAAYVSLGLLALGWSASRLPASRERAGAGLVLAGALVGLVPFLIVAVVFPALFHTEKFLIYGLVPLAVVPLTFAFAIIRYGLLDVRVILRRSLLYTTTTAVVTAAYAAAIAAFNFLFRSTELAASRYFPILLAFAIVLLFEPLRRRIQVPVDRFFFADRTRLQGALVEMGEAFTGRLDPGAVVADLVEELPRLLELRFAALYLLRGETFERCAGPASLPSSLPLVEGFYRQVHSYTTLTRLDDVAELRLNTPQVRKLVEQLQMHGVEVVGDLATSRRRIGLILLAGRAEGRLPLEEEELRLLRGLLHQAAIALETSLLLEERAQQAEIERELEIASAIQRSILPRDLQLGGDWDVAAVCRPARHVGGDFFASLPGPNGAHPALVYGDVSGKSVSGALLMMAAKEALHSLSLAHRDPEELLALANRRLHELSSRSFVALGYLAPSADGVTYLLAGQPPPLKRAADGTVEPLALPSHRLPLGAMMRGRHRKLSIPIGPGELLLGYSDGVVEAHRAGGEFFGEARLQEVLAEAPPDPRAVVDRVLRALDEHTGGEEAYDDVTLIAMARRVPGAAPGEEGR